GGAALAAVPIVTSGFYSKEQILAGAWSAERAGPLLWLAGVMTAFVTSVYIFRAIFIVFFGPPGQRPPIAQRRAAITVPLVVLAVLFATSACMRCSSRKPAEASQSACRASWVGAAIQLRLFPTAASRHGYRSAPGPLRHIAQPHARAGRRMRERETGRVEQISALPRRRVALRHASSGGTRARQT